MADPGLMKPAATIGNVGVRLARNDSPADCIDGWWGSRPWRPTMQWFPLLDKKYLQALCRGHCGRGHAARTNSRDDDVISLRRDHP